ncbi:NYN domain-containing protein [Nocardioides sp. GY 10113]|uniref:NYN domain-containing protein n=1 Tax=Nocardioides sp. GY 10113 TaxID=2569761 RepID=UPI0010A8C3E9|nr:NYN domain-containing protein [Nocardioides sp. GY 10113]TIC85888.1 NYN domain-containing protein [Nocardioides sp. GY 10113]
MTTSSPTPNVRVAVLIDADNTSPRHASALLSELAQYGVATVKRAYGDWTTSQLTGWKTQLNQHAIAPVQQFAYTTGKNATDSALIIDAMDLLYSGNLDAFALVSSDSDFTRLATRLREGGKTVYGLGLRKTPASLVAACDTFIYLELLGDDADEEPTDQATGSAPEGEDPPLPNLQSLLTRAVNKQSQDDGWADLGAIGQYLRSANSSFDPRLYGFAKLVDLVEGQPYLVTEKSGNGVQVRLKGGAPKKAPARRSTAKKSAAKKAD